MTRRQRNISLIALGTLVIAVIGSCIFFSYEKKVAAARTNQLSRILIDTFLNMPPRKSVFFQMDALPTDSDFYDKLLSNMPIMSFEPIRIVLTQYQVKEKNERIYNSRQTTAFPTDYKSTDITFKPCDLPLLMRWFYYISPDTVIEYPQKRWRAAGIKEIRPGEYRLSVPTNHTDDWRGWLAVYRSNVRCMPTKDVEWKPGASEDGWVCLPNDSAKYDVVTVGILQLPNLPSPSSDTIDHYLIEFYNKRQTFLNVDQIALTGETTPIH